MVTIGWSDFGISVRAIFFFQKLMGLTPLYYLDTETGICFRPSIVVSSYAPTC